MGITSLLMTLGGFLGGLLSLKFLLIKHYRVNRSVGGLLYHKVTNESTFKFIIEEEMVFDGKEPQIFKCLVHVNGFFMLFDKDERLLTAGWTPKEHILDIYFFRWNADKAKSLLNEINQREKIVNVYAVVPNESVHIGTLDCTKPSIVLDKDLYEDIESDVVRALNGEIGKTSALLYGSPGNGKSRFVKYIAQKYELPIYSFYFNPEYNNLDILQSFSNIPKRSIILLEDFDNYFDDRKCIMPSENIKFTFDVFLSSLDGVYNEYKETIFFMTVNDITKVSNALTKRPSRFKYVREFTNPSLELREELLGESFEELGDISLDQVFKLKDYKDLKGVLMLEEAKKLIG
jgi:hypothetical protein